MGTVDLPQLFFQGRSSGALLSSWQAMTKAKLRYINTWRINGSVD